MLASHAAFVRNAYAGSVHDTPSAPPRAGTLRLAQHSLYHDNRRLRAPLRLSDVDAMPEITQQTAALQPLLDRMGTLLAALLAATGTLHGPHAAVDDAWSLAPVVIVGHSRFLREFLYLFQAGRHRSTGPLGASPQWRLRAAHLGS